MTSMTLVSPASAPAVITVGGCVQAVIEKGNGERRFDVDRPPGHHAGEHDSHENVEDGASNQRGNDTDGQIALRVLGFLRGGGNGVEADVGKEICMPPLCQIPPTAHGREFGPAVTPVGGVHVFQAQEDDEEHDADLDDHDGGVEVRTFLDADHQDRGDDQRDARTPAS